MRIAFTLQNNNNKDKKQNLSFEAGLTPRMMHEIQRADVLEISDRLAEKDIPNNLALRGNKIIAWCCDKTVGIFERLNQPLPLGIYAEDFADLDVESLSMMGFCNLQPTEELIKGLKGRVPSRTVFFNTFETIRDQTPPEGRGLYNWENVNEIANFRYAKRHWSTDHFLYPFLHEFTHVAHEERLLDKFGGETLAKMFETLYDEKQLQKYRKVCGPQFSWLCEYAARTNPLEAIACDGARRIAKCIDKKTLVPTKNPFLRLPYQEEDLSLWQRLQVKIHPVNKTLSDFWDGNFEYFQAA